MNAKQKYFSFSLGLDDPNPTEKATRAHFGAKRFETSLPFVLELENQTNPQQA